MAQAIRNAGADGVVQPATIVMLGLEFVHDPQTKEPAPDLVNAILNEARARGLLLLKAGLYGNVVRVLVPLVIEDELFAQALTTLSLVIKQVALTHKQ
jgi:4-aminobutyrate aminotransferase/(S)-3-amino-2-methylpropionate transaminase